MTWQERIVQERIVLVGGSGLVGKALLTRLEDLGVDKVVVFDRHPPTFRPTRLKIEYRQGDLMHLDDVRRGIEGCSAVAHLAGLKHAGKAQQQPLTCFEVNTGGTAIIMEACRLEQVSCILFLSTALVYGPLKAEAHRESDRAHAPSIYAASKLAAEAVVAGYAKSYGIAACIARLTNVYGGLIDPETVVGLAATQAKQGGPISLRSHTALCDLIAVEDVAEGLLRLLAVGSSWPLIVNLCSGKLVTTGFIAHTIAEAAATLGFERPVVAPLLTVEEKPLSSQGFSNDLLQNITHWSPQMTIVDGFAKMLAIESNGD